MRYLDIWEIYQKTCPRKYASRCSSKRGLNVSRSKKSTVCECDSRPTSKVFTSQIVNTKFSQYTILRRKRSRVLTKYFIEKQSLCFQILNSWLLVLTRTLEMRRSLVVINSSKIVYCLSSWFELCECTILQHTLGIFIKKSAITHHNRNSISKDLKIIA